MKHLLLFAVLAISFGACGPKPVASNTPTPAATPIATATATPIAADPSPTPGGDLGTAPMATPAINTDRSLIAPAPGTTDAAPPEIKL